MKPMLAAMLVFCVISAASAEPVSVGDTGVTFEPPAGFKPVPKRIRDLKWPSNRAPRYVVGNEAATTTVAYDLKPHVIPQSGLREAQAQFTQLFGGVIPSLVWKKNEIVEHSGRKWVLMEMTSSAVDTDIYNIMLVTGYKNQMLLFNFNSTKEDFPKYEKLLRASLYSITIPDAND
ncbi:hypothetical protein Mal64_39110 [Pseudobythopirellula maris]|uniref:DUF1795 domain-containing protein n=1 Tax=Pseudobythopirellula maris TaxID=2527991 RepID=A0A5C5ZH25_9BACT|nr:hypothetical protein [Pseudobythopirellula maris]TWT86171.1 hypothetical protein Mal64_39110 [Pseudobythopirellula maris]